MSKFNLRKVDISLFSLFSFFFIVNFNVFRTSKFYILVYGFSLIVILFCLIRSKIHWPNNLVGWGVCAFVFSSIFIVYQSYANLSFSSFYTGLTRFYFVYPLLAIALICINRSAFTYCANVYVLMVALAACTLIAQSYNGAIPYFADSSTRGGVSRYATFLGALPTYGVAGGFGLLYTGYCCARPYLFAFLFLVIFTGMILTLQKAALVNLIIVCTMLFWQSCNGRLCVKPTKFLVIICASLFVNYIAFANSFAVNADFIGIDISRYTGRTIEWTGYGIREDMNMRLANQFLTQGGDSGVELSHGGESRYGHLSEILFGIGYQALGGALGLDSYPMSHNGFVDIWRLGGFTYMTAFLFLCFSVAYQLGKSVKISCYTPYARTFFLLFAINFIFYTGIFVNPSLSCMFWLNLAYLCKIKRNA